MLVDNEAEELCSDADGNSEMEIESDTQTEEEEQMSIQNVPNKAKPEDTETDQAEELSDEKSEKSEDCYPITVKWLLYPNDCEDDIETIDHRLESLQVKGKLLLI